MVSNILIFDSGVGGLSVYQEIHQLLPQHNYIYFFDNQAYPYGELAPVTLLQRVQLFVTRMVEIHDIDVVVIACNTASTIVLPILREILSMPVVGVVPAIKPACNLAHKSVGLIATPATIKRPYTHELIHDFSYNKEVILLGSTKLVDISEEKMRGKAADLGVMKKILQPLLNKVDVAVLGCTHFPLIRDEIQEVLGREVLLVDSGQAIAKRVQGLLRQQEKRHCKKASLIFSSALPFQEKALNHTLKDLGFNPVAWFRDFSGHLQCGL